MMNKQEMRHHKARVRKLLESAGYKDRSVDRYLDDFVDLEDMEMVKDLTDNDRIQDYQLFRSITNVDIIKVG